MRIDELSRRTFLLAGGAAMAGAVVGCGGAGISVDATLPSDPGGDQEVTPTLALPRDPMAEALDAARDANPTLAFLTRHDFDRWHGESFDLTNAAGDTITVELIAVHDESALMNADSRELGLREPFSVQFFGPLAGDHQEGPYTVAHPDMGRIDTFVCYQGTTEESDERPAGGDHSVYALYFN